jgi:uncharacterized protein with GYD domain
LAILVVGEGVCILEVVRLSSERRSAMATYIILINYTDQGIRNVKESPKRLDAAKKLLKGMGANSNSSI